jgi:hypothetical protein
MIRATAVFFLSSPYISSGCNPHRTLLAFSLQLLRRVQAHVTTDDSMNRRRRRPLNTRRQPKREGNWAYLKKINEWTYLIAGSFVDGSGLDECIIQVEENGINPLQVVVMMVTVSSSIKGTRFRSCCFHHALHGRLQITVWDCLESSCQYLCTSSCVPPTPTP